MKKEGTLSKSPIKETLGTWSNIKLVLVAMFAMVVPQSVLLVGAQIYTLIFLTGTLQMDPQIANLLVLTGLLIGLPAFVISGTLSDRFGTKIFITSACLIGALAYIPLYKALTFYANPALYVAQNTVPIFVEADPQECSLQFNPVGTSTFTSGCDIVKDALIRTGAPYSNKAAPAGAIATVHIGAITIPVVASGNPPDRGLFRSRLVLALKDAGYPTGADRKAMNYPMIVFILATLSAIAGMIFGPLAAAMTSFFPARIRYTSVSFTYHVGNGLFGGLLPAISLAIQTSTGNIYGGLWYTVIVAGIAFFLALFLLPSKRSQVLTASPKSTPPFRANT
jgi:hypothetical protein